MKLIKNTSAWNNNCWFKINLIETKAIAFSKFFKRFIVYRKVNYEVN
ncbi:hypothetical protein HYP07_gp087 [Vibrio phage JSF3]|nr:hypothetical protein HYP07_gp087 [Vibrio phage JSF3]APD18099.1 hypothetical protein [Vibrio phage JSF3]